MKKKNLSMAALIAAVIMLTSVEALAQRGNRSGSYFCCDNLPGLTEKQRTEITALEKAHRADMDAMRAERRKSGNYTTREAYQNLVDEKVAAHRGKVRALLNEEQKAVFDNMQIRPGRGQYGRAGYRPGAGQAGFGRRGRGWNR
ncbi:MAG TPA: hypothetical protein PLD74_00915 [Prolixibacteraceae bacterium]|nr:hypothetical protein [Prolixibacteraceae bacterium]HQH74983.1 hypothetical protein [Prolixibacteraceae bacterium]